MFNKKIHYANAIQKVRINLGTLMGLENDDECHVTLREPSEMEVLKLRTEIEKDGIGGVQFFKDILPRLLVDHDFYEDDSVRMKSEDVIELIFEKTSVAEKVLSSYTEEVFRSHPHKEE